MVLFYIFINNDILSIQLFLFFKLNAISEDWANELAEKNQFFHRPNNKYGENLYYIQSTTEVTEVGVSAVDSWYSEIEFFDFQGTSAEMDSATRACNLIKISIIYFYAMYTYLISLRLREL